MFTTTGNVSATVTATAAEEGLACARVDAPRDRRIAAARRAACCDHFVQLFEHEAFMVEALADWLAAGLDAGEACILVATAEQSLAIAEALLPLGLDAAALGEAGQLLQVDAHEALLHVSNGDSVDARSVEAYFGDLVDTAAAAHPGLRVFNGLAVLLVQQGAPEQADRLEACWDELATQRGFALYCAYPIALFGSEGNGRHFHGISDRHRAVIPAESYLALEDDAARNRAVGALQQKALALEDETARRMREQARVRQRDERLRLLGELSQDATWVNRGGRIVEVNEYCLELLGAAHEWQVVGRSPFDFIHPDWHAVVRERIESLSSGYGDVPPQRIGLLRLDGREVEAIVSAASYDDDGEPAIQVVLRDARRATPDPAAAHFDETTGLPDRSGFALALAAQLEEATRSGRQVAVLHVDLDRFKLVNDTLGHETGDEILRQASARLKRAVRPGNLLARFGGDEFVLFATGDDAEREGRRVAAALIAAFHEPFAAAGRMIFSTLSIGVALHPRDGGDAAELMRAADLALHVSKQSGGNVAAFYRPALAVDSLARLDLENRLHRALDQDELRLCYQPIYEVSTGRIVAVEALLRWFPADGPAMMPAEFIPVAEETGLIQPIGDWVLRTACMQVRQWQRRCDALAGLRVHVNVSPRQLRDMDTRGSVQRFLEESGLPATCLTLELTESTFLKDFEPTLRNLERLREMGVRLSIDDFGTGYSCLDYLRRLPIDELKIDRSFVHDLGRDPSNGALVAAILAMARALGLSVVAEGVETWEQLEALRDKGCRRVQGYGLGRPMFADDAAAFLESRAAVPAASFTAAAFPRP